MTMSMLRLVTSIVATTRCAFPIHATISAAGPKLFSSGVSLPPDIHYEELKASIEASNITSIDVRESYELTDCGKIPKALNIALQTLGQDLLMPDNEFEELNGFKKPDVEAPLAVYCLAGVRARTAQLALIGLGYKNVRRYAGSFDDWVDKGGPVDYPGKECDADVKDEL